MNLIDRTFDDVCWYWDPPKVNVDGSKTMGTPMPVSGRWDDNPAVDEKAQAQEIRLAARFSTNTVIVAGGWLINNRDITPGEDLSAVDPRTRQKAREIGTVNVQRSYDDQFFYIGNLK